MFKIYCTKENSSYAHIIATALKNELVVIQSVKFTGGEKLFSLKKDTVSEKAIIVHPLSPSADSKIFELMFLLDLLEENGTKEVILITPFIPYLRQDRELVDISSIGARTIAKILKPTIIKEIITIDIHSDRSLNFFTQSVVNLNCYELFKQKLQLLGISLEKAVVIAPDHGSTTRAEKLSRLLNLPNLTLQKIRTDKIVTCLGFGANDNYSTAIIIDDIIDTGSTIKAAINLIKDKVENIVICATHIINLAAIQSIKGINKNIKVIATNSTQQKIENEDIDVWKEIGERLKSIKV